MSCFSLLFYQALLLGKTQRELENEGKKEAGNQQGFLN